MTEFIRRLPRALLFLGRGAMTSVAGNLSLAALSAALAVSLWLFVVNRENPREVQQFNSAITVKFINAPNDLAIANVSANTVRIRVEATTNTLRGLQARDFQATVNLGGFSKGDVTAAVEVDPPNSDVSVVGVEPAQIDVTLDTLVTKDVPVQFNLIGSPQQGFQALESSATASPPQVTVSGAASLVETVDAAWADVILTGRRVDLDGERIQLTPRDSQRRDVGLVTVDPSAAAISLKIQQQQFTRTVIVSPTISGVPATGYNVIGVSVNPAIVQVTGAADVVASIDAVQGLPTGEVPIDGSRADVVRTVPVTVPNGVTLQGSPNVQVTVSIRPAQGEAIFRVVPRIRNLGSGLAVTIAQPLEITLAGDIPTLDALTPDAITVIADAQGLGPGLYTLDVQITPPAATTVVRTEPAQLGVAITARQ